MQTLPDGNTVNVTIPDGVPPGGKFQFDPAAAAAATADIPVPEIEKVDRDVNVFDNNKGLCVVGHIFVGDSVWLYGARVKPPVRCPPNQ